MIAGVGYKAPEINPPTPKTTGNDSWESIFARRDANKRADETARAKAEADKEKKKSDAAKDAWANLQDIDATGAFVKDQAFIANQWNDIANYVTENISDLDNIEKQMELQKKLLNYKQVIDWSKETATNYVAEKDKQKEGGWLNTEEPLLNIYEDNLEIEIPDASGTPVKKSAKIQDAKSFEDYFATHLARQSEFEKPFKENPIEQQITKIWKLLTDPTVKEVETGNGRTQAVTEVTPEEARYRLQNLWNSNREFQRQAEYDYKQALKNTPDAIVGNTGKTVKEMKDAREYVVESQAPVITRKDVRLEGSEKTENIRKNFGGGKGQIGKAIFTRFIKDNGDAIYTFEGATEAENPKREFVTTTGESISGRPYQWVKEKGKTPVLTIRRDLGNGRWKEYTVAYDKAVGAGLQYANPFEMDAVLGEGEEGTSAKNTSIVTQQAAPKAKTQAEWNAEWAKLKKGESLVGLDGKTYIKK